jgi:hypothetical protein
VSSSKVKKAAVEVVRAQNEALTEHDLAIAETLEAVDELREVSRSLDKRATSKSSEMKAVIARLDRIEERLRRYTPIPPAK